MAYQEWQQVNERIRRKIFEPGDRMMSMLVDFKAGGSGPEHAHPHEQLSYVVSGSIELTIDGRKYVVQAGEQIRVPGNAPHSVVALEDTLVLETFTPVREDLLQ